ncbi:MAG: carbohydrate-binding family 9-like protein [Gemmatimonadetes bacterium]|jgi:hypothetical protein|nr:carbohydrate-binding family 9-like protein [Gemmatimonadota bacterium]MBT5057448.1 carbohydrate-binding family 9-like protein [Gemmatimonadota bacterium]MBT5143593.1 carbohydrate-binding family 9-like protein [Gemmatimonadota bacterium]MBT5588921.1 carbohydrate-binding family 9-like protein [Gemmatimonadota bacterium]MBT5961377.1 carbohydrate-binding family 9-like protein [Gemmatimonadota bacterium]
MRSSLFVMALMICTAASAMGQRVLDLPEGLPSMVIERAPGPIKIDGQVDNIWKKAESVDFVFPWNDTAAEDAQSTQARMLWDDDNLYLLFECVDPFLDSEVTEKDGPVYQEDAVEIFATPRAEDVTAYFGYEMNINGALLDYMAFEGGEQHTKSIHFNWENEGVEIATSFDGTLNDHADTDAGWILEMVIPFDNFRHLGGTIPPVEGDVWRLNLNRTKGYNGQFSQWSDSATDHADFHRSARFGRATFTMKVAK